jgi:predicted small lipoprotein YifL
MEYVLCGGGKMKKSLNFFLIAAIVSFSLTACGGSKNDAPAQRGGEERSKTKEMDDAQSGDSENGGVDAREGLANPWVALRSEYRNVTKQEAEEMVKRLGFHTQDAKLKPYGKFVHHYAAKDFDGDRVVVDHVTGLMWYPSGSDRYITYDEIESWLAGLNAQAYAGFSDWRLPTLEEAASLIEDSVKNGNLYIDPLFSKEQHDIWTGDFMSYPDLREKDYEGNDIGPYPPAQWVVGFWNAGMNPTNRDSGFSLRPVRSLSGNGE